MLYDKRIHERICFTHVDHLNTPPRAISCIILNDTPALLSHNIDFIWVYEHLASPLTCVIQPSSCLVQFGITLQITHQHPSLFTLIINFLLSPLTPPSVYYPKIPSAFYVSVTPVIVFLLISCIVCELPNYICLILIFGHRTFIISIIHQKPYSN